MTEKEVTVFVVFGTLDIKCSALPICINHQVVPSSPLCGGYGSDIELAKFHLCFDAKEILGALDEAILDG